MLAASLSPKIQPIEDPDPIMLEPRHRIYSSATGQWHEVVGDDAARAILGDEVFMNGPREVRSKRAQAIPGFPSTFTSSDATAATTSGVNDYGLNGTVEDGFGTGGRGAVEREGVLGGEMGDWASVQRRGFFGRKESGDAGTAW